jgi:hypothetical protein
MPATEATEVTERILMFGSVHSVCSVVIGKLEAVRGVLDD